MSKPLSHKARFERYRDDTVIQKCTQYAKWTLPQLMQDVTVAGLGHTGTVERDYQETGPMLVNNLAAKITALLFPSSRPFFEAAYGPEIIEAANRRGVQETELKAAMSKLVLDSCARIFRNASYAQLVQASRHLIVTGNVCVYRNGKKNSCTTYGLRSFAVRRDGEGTVLDLVIRECTYIEALPIDVQRALRAAYPSKYRRVDDAPPVELYTRVERKVSNSGRAFYVVTQEADEIPVGTPGQYPEHLCPWVVVTWNLVAGENYGRGLVEDYAGGFAKLSDGSEAATLYGIEIMRVLNLVAPGTGADIDELATAESGQYVQGANGAVSAYEAGDANKLVAMRAEIQETVTNLSRAFMWQANTRDAERVTAYELRQQALEADHVLGGAYSSLAATWQVPFAHLLLLEEKPDLLAGIVTESIKLDIVAGVQALGRSVDLQNLTQAAQDIAAILPIFTQASRKVDSQKLFDIILSLSNVNPQDFYKSPEQLKVEAEAQAQIQQGQNDMLSAQAGAETAQTLQSIQAQGQ